MNGVSLTLIFRPNSPLNIIHIYVFARRVSPHLPVINFASRRVRPLIRRRTTEFITRTIELPIWRLKEPHRRGQVSIAERCKDPFREIVLVNSSRRFIARHLIVQSAGAGKEARDNRETTADTRHLSPPVASIFLSNRPR